VTDSKSVSQMNVGISMVGAHLRMFVFSKRTTLLMSLIFTAMVGWLVGSLCREYFSAWVCKWLKVFLPNCKPKRFIALPS
jgi:hypothetical protein